MTDPILEEALAYLRKKPIDGYEIYWSESSQRSVESKEGKVDFLEASRSSGVAFRILNRHHMGFSYFTSSDPKDLGRKIDDLIETLPFISPDPCYDLAPALEKPVPAVSIFDEVLETVPEQEKIERARLLEEAARSVDPRRIRTVRKASYQEIVSRRTLINSEGLHFSYEASLVSASVTAVAEESGESETGFDFEISHFLKDLDMARVGQSAGRRALERLGGRKIRSGSYPVVLQNRVASDLLSLLPHAFLSEQVQKGKSPLAGKRGQRCFSPLVSITDDGLYPAGIGTCPLDAEGTPSQRTVLVVEGEILGYLYDRYWANRENALQGAPKRSSTGNSRRAAIKSPPVTGISNFFIEPGRVSFSELLESLHVGLVVEEVMGLHTVDPISGDFSFGCSGYWVERGKRTHAVKSVAMAGNLFELFRRVSGVARDIRFFGGVGSPSLLVEGVEISGI